jgi:hypothetical protein
LFHLKSENAKLNKLMFKRSIILVFIFSISLCGRAQSNDRYSMGNKRKARHHLHLNIKHLFRSDPMKEADKKKQIAEDKERKQQIKDVKEYQKKHNTGKSTSTGKPAYESIKKNKRKSKRVNDNKPADPWIVRIFKRYK